MTNFEFTTMKTFVIQFTADFFYVKNNTEHNGQVSITRTINAESEEEAMDKCPWIKEKDIEAAAKKQLTQMGRRYDFVFAGEIASTYIAN